MNVDAFIATVEDMRYWQKRFFRAPPASKERVEALRKSKHGEQLVDAMIAELRSPQKSLEGIR